MGFRLVNDYLILIDGYNLIFQCGLEGKSRTPASLQRGRNRLVGELEVGLPESIKQRTALVFDATRLPSGESRSTTQTESGLTVIYALGYEDADTLIEILIQKNSTPKKLTVVSSDHRLHKAALRRKSTPVDSDQWFDQITGESTKELANESIEEKKLQIEQLDKIDWLEEFGLDRGVADENKNSDERLSLDERTNYDPFPPGYADDLLDGDD